MPDNNDHLRDPSIIILGVYTVLLMIGIGVAIISDSISREPVDSPIVECYTAPIETQTE